jgi:hypothetical protein
MIAMLPLGILYFTRGDVPDGVVVVHRSAGAARFGAFDGWWLDNYDVGPLSFNNYEVASSLRFFEYPLVFLFGIVLFFATLHLARGWARCTACSRKHLLVKSAQYA